MFWKKDAEMEKKLMQMNELLKKSFANVKRDTSNIFQWLNYFYRRGVEQEQTINQLRMELSYMPKTRDEIRQIIDNYYSFDSIFAKIRELNEKVDGLAGMRVQVDTPHSISYPISKELQTYVNNIERRIDALEQRKASIKEKIIKRLARNSKEYVKSVIVSYIKKYERVSALQLKEMVVDEQNFCSKSSFYRILEEIGELEEIGVMKQGKEKHYIAKALKRV